MLSSFYCLVKSSRSVKKQKTFMNKNFKIKKLSLFLVFALVLMSGFISAPNAEAAITTITITSPNGGEAWSGIHNITWTSDATTSTDKVSIYRCIGGDCSSNQTLIASSVTSTDATYSWDTAGLNETDKI